MNLAPRKKPEVDTGAIQPAQPPQQGGSGLPALDAPDFDAKMARMERLAYLRTMERMAGGEEKRAAPAPVNPGPPQPAGLTQVTRTVQTLKEFYESEAMLRTLMASRQDNPTWLRILDTKAGEGLGVALGRVVEGVISAYDRRQQLTAELQMQKLKAAAKPAPAEGGGGFDLFGDGGGSDSSSGGAAAPLSSSSSSASVQAPPQSVGLDPADKELIRKQDEKIAALMKGMENLSQVVGILAQRETAREPGAEMKTYRFACRAKGCEHRSLVVAPNEASASASFKKHLQTHGEFVQAAQEAAAGGVTPQQAAAFAAAWVTVEELKGDGQEG